MAANAASRQVNPRALSVIAGAKGTASLFILFLLSFGYFFPRYLCGKAAMRFWAIRRKTGGRTRYATIFPYMAGVAKSATCRFFPNNCEQNQAPLRMEITF